RNVVDTRADMPTPGLHGRADAMVGRRRDVLDCDAVLSTCGRGQEHLTEHDGQDKDSEPAPSPHDTDLLGGPSGRPGFPRTRGAGVTDDLSAAWPAAQRELLRTLRRRGLSADDAGDIAQDVAERALRSGVAFEGHDSLMRWCHAVARNLTIDAARRRARLA